MSEQLELLLDVPFMLRLPFPEALALFGALYWFRLPIGKKSKSHFLRLKTFFANHYLDTITKTNIAQMREAFAAQGLKGNTINKAHCIMSRVFSKFEEWKDARYVEGHDFSRLSLPRKNPASLVPRVNERQFQRNVAWPKKVVYKLIRTAEIFGDTDMAEIIEVLYLTRLRPGDLWLMTEKNVNLARRIIFGIQHKTITTRYPSGVPYLIPISPRVAEILERRISRAVGGVLFKRTNLQKRFKAVRIAASLKHVQLRDFRPSSATLLLDNGIDPETVRDSLGHTTLRLLPSYAPRKLVHLAKAQAVLEDKETEILT